MQHDRERNQWGKCTSATDVVCAWAYRYMPYRKKHAIIEAGIEAWLCWKIRRTKDRHSKYITPGFLIKMLCLFQTQQVLWMSTAVCVKMSFTAVCTSSLTHFVLVSWPQTRYLVTANREKSCKDSVSLRWNTNRQHSQLDDSFIRFFGGAPNCFSCVIQSGEKPSNVQEAVQLIPEKEASGHFLSPAFLQLSPHQAWLATVGRDGLLCICEISTMVLSVKTTLHKFIHVYEHWAWSNMFLRKRAKYLRSM